MAVQKSPIVSDLRRSDDGHRSILKKKQHAAAIFFCEAMAQVAIRLFLRFAGMKL